MNCMMQFGLYGSVWYPTTNSVVLYIKGIVYHKSATVDFLSITTVNFHFDHG